MQSIVSIEYSIVFCQFAAWIGEDFDADGEAERVTTPVQRLTPGAGSVLSSVREFDEGETNVS